MFAVLISGPIATGFEVVVRCILCLSLIEKERWYDGMGCVCVCVFLHVFMCLCIRADVRVRVYICKVRSVVVLVKAVTGNCTAG